LGAPTTIPPFFPPKRLVLVRNVREGAARFAFLLETCPPGSVPDAPLVAALLELVAFFFVFLCLLH
jgi:hypothetical protein